MYDLSRLPERTYLSDFVVHGVECITVQFSYVWHNQWLILSATRTQDSSIDRSTGTGFYRLPVRTYFSDFIVHGVECITVQFSYVWPLPIACTYVFLRFCSAWCGMYNCSVPLCMALSVAHLVSKQDAGQLHRPFDWHRLLPIACTYIFLRFCSWDIPGMQQPSMSRIFAASRVSLTSLVGHTLI